MNAKVDKMNAIIRAMSSSLYGHQLESELCRIWAERNPGYSAPFAPDYFVQAQEDQCWLENQYEANEPLFIEEKGCCYVSRHNGMKVQAVRNFVTPMLEHVNVHWWGSVPKFIWEECLIPKFVWCDGVVYSCTERILFKDLDEDIYCSADDVKNDFIIFLLDQFGSLDALKQHLVAA